ncbi:LuxR C-terminal-related transcriptional regulator [Streptomyces sp. NPDC007355]|uniref:LuxR C-terminal-related transcriptional regulator n=1 Tax=Streptomyces sp. NPDC007355 TaxID=3364778 RepID=UPI00368FA5CD
MGRQDSKFPRWPLTGRESELEAFSAAWATRRCEGLVIFGPAGVGKSRLAEECLARAVREGWKGERATASAAAAAVPLGAITHLIPSGVDLSDPVQGFAQVVSALAGPDRKRRWAVWVDDLHLLDAASAVLLRQLLDAGVVRLIGTVRTGQPVGETVDALCGSDGMYRIDLTGLGRDQVEVLLHKALGGPVARHTLYQLHTASGGNMLYLHELITGALRIGSLASDGEIWELALGRPVGTPKLTELIEARLATAAPMARPILELLALCEPLPLADAQQAASLEVLADLEEAGLVQVITDRRRTTLALVHPLYGEVLRAGIPPLRRRIQLLAQVERTRAYGARRREDALHLATWQLAATGTADTTVLVQAAALARHAHDYPQVVALLEAVPDRQRTLAIGLVLGEAFLQMGNQDQAEAVLAKTDALAVEESDKLAVTLPRTANLMWRNAPISEALAVNEAARAQVTSPAGRHMLQINEGYMRIAAGQPVRGLTQLENLETEADVSSDINAWLRGALTKPFGLALVGRTAEAAAWTERAYAVHCQVDEHALVSHPAIQRVPLVLALSEAGRLSEARQTGEKAYAELVADDMVRIFLALLLGRTEWLAGHIASARRWWAEAAALARAINLAKILRLALGGIAACAALNRDLGAAETALAEHQALPLLAPGLLSAGEERLGEAWMYANRGHLTQARTVLTEAAQVAHTTGHTTGEALLLTDVARLGGAKEVVNRLAELATLCDGALAPARAHLAAALTADDPARLIEAADEMEMIGADLLAAEAATAAAAAWRRAGQARKAAAAAQQAQACAARCQGAHTPLLAAAESAVMLTSRENEIAQLAAAGTASKDIADTLQLSVRTVDNHLQRAYAKLGVTTRRELALALGMSPASR